jgi:hypothetical protein
VRIGAVERPDHRAIAGAQREERRHGHCRSAHDHQAVVIPRSDL